MQGPQRMGFLLGNRRPLRRFVYLLIVWSFLCYAIFQFTTRSESSVYIGNNVNTRLLLQKVTEMPVSTTSTAGAAAAAAAAAAAGAPTETTTARADTIKTTKYTSF